jgi:hypothetical protein
VSVEIRPVGLASCGTLVWRYRGQLRVTAIVKATFAFVPGAKMRLLPPDDLHRAPVPWDARKSLWAESDLVPFRLRADVVLVGHAYLPPGGGMVRLAVKGDETLVDRSLGVSDDVGDGAPVSLSYERAFGGPRWPDNPVGTGRAPGSPLPAVVDPSGPRRPGGFGPVARTWPARAKLLGSIDPAVFAGPIAEIPGDLDWAYFQAAPPGQVTDFLRGDEHVELDGMSREHPSLRTQLPGARAVGRVYGLSSAVGKAVTIAFRADDLHLDADRMRGSLTWRASFSVPGEEILPTLVLVAGIELPGQAVPWPERLDLPAPPEPPRAEQPSLSDQPTYADTERIRVTPGMLPSVPTAEPPKPVPEPAPDVDVDVDVDIADDDSQLELETLPFSTEAPSPRRQGTVVLEAAAPSPGRHGTVVLEAVAPLPGRQGTVVLEAAEPSRRHATELLEWPATTGEAPPAPPVTEGRQPTMVLDAVSDRMGTLPFSADRAPVPAPFRLAEPGAPAASAAPEIPGAPWSSRPASSLARAPAAEITRALALDPRLTIPDDLLHEYLAAPPPPPVRAPPQPPARPLRREIARPMVKPTVRARYPRKRA